MLYIAFVCIFLSIFLFTYNKNHLSKKKKKSINSCKSAGLGAIRQISSAYIHTQVIYITSNLGLN